MFYSLKDTRFGPLSRKKQKKVFAPKNFFSIFLESLVLCPEIFMKGDGKCFLLFLSMTHSKSVTRWDLKKKCHFPFWLILQHSSTALLTLYLMNLLTLKTKQKRKIWYI